MKAEISRRSTSQRKKSRMTWIVSGLLVLCLTLAACGTSPPAETITSLELGTDDTMILKAAPVEISSKEEAAAVQLFQNNPSGSDRYPIFYQGQRMDLTFNDNIIPDSCKLEIYPLNPQGNLLYAENLHQEISIEEFDARHSFDLSICPEWGLSDDALLGFAVYPQGYILRCETDGRESVFVFRLGLTPSVMDQSGNLTGIKPEAAGGSPNLSSFNMMRVPADENGDYGPTYLLTREEQAEVLALMNTENWKTARELEPRDLDTVFYMRNPDGVSLYMEDNPDDNTVYVLINNWQGTERLLYEAPRQMVANLIEYATNFKSMME